MDFNSARFLRPSAYLKQTLLSSPSSSYSPTTAPTLPSHCSPQLSASPPSTSSSLSNPPLNSILQVMGNERQEMEDDSWTDLLNLGSQSTNSTLRASQLNTQMETPAFGGFSDDLIFPIELEHHRSPSNHASIQDIFPSHFSPILSSVSPSPTFMHAMPGSGPASMPFSPVHAMTPERRYFQQSPHAAEIALQSRMSPFAGYESEGYQTDPLSPLTNGQFSNMHLSDTMSSPMQGYMTNMSQSAPTQHVPFADIFLSNGSLNPLATQLRTAPALSPSPKIEPEPELDANHADDDDSVDSTPELDTDDADRPVRKHTRIPLPIPVPNLTKKSRGRHVPTLPSSQTGQLGIMHSASSRDEVMAASKIAAEQLASVSSTHLPPAELLAHLTDVHCHPTDSDTPKDVMEALVIRVCAMATRSDDQEKVADLAREWPDKVTPCFGYHPWFSHTISLLQKLPNKEEHYASILLSGKDASPENSLKLQEMLPLLPEPRLLKDIVAEVRNNLVAHPQAMLGEVGLDRAFRIPMRPYPSPPPRKLSPFSVPMGHQLAILEALLGVAVALKRNVSMHSVKCQQVTVELFKRMKALHNEKWGSINIDLHSCGFSAETWKEVERNYPNVYLSLSTTINAKNGGVAALIQAAAETRILIESDWHDITLCTGSAWDILRYIAEVKGWRVEDTWEEHVQGEPGAVRRIEENWNSFKSGGKGLAPEHIASNHRDRRRRDHSVDELDSDVEE
ncbi:Metallo-dependent hydrolase [Dacryopinax primogenitus]|uniref:Metallo-dependent hydrolase n=1 Tax=Dacryopinax primogenitus (strain DJM 731) TaxID=1858805 RepID=M5G9U7_DACPD|nr:Metallo-dependent hydrolase [Dacryopinax primogenitus]EJU02652.1 Metallo-dependent hydrolase [Dacryopinax primogenitus]